MGGPDPPELPGEALSDARGDARASPLYPETNGAKVRVTSLRFQKRAVKMCQPSGNRKRSRNENPSELGRAHADRKGARLARFVRNRRACVEFAF